MTSRQILKQVRQDVGCQGGDDPEAQRPDQDTAAMMSQVHEVGGCVENVPGALGDLGAKCGECRLARAALYQFDSKESLKFTDLHRECRLAHSALLRRPTEVSVPRKRTEVAKLPQRKHGHNAVSLLRDRVSI